MAPPPPTGQKEVSEPEPQRRLIGATDEQVKNIEQFLPPGSQIYLSPIGSDESKAAVAEADLDADGIVETIVVHRWRMPTQRDATPPLSLSVLNSSGRASSGIVSVSLEGGVLFNIELSGKSIPLVVKDLTGDHVPEIVVASGIGASLGGVLHVFRLQGSSLVAVLKLDGNAFRITQSGLITAQSRYQKKAASYRWNGQRFVLLGEDF